MKIKSREVKTHLVELMALGDKKFPFKLRYAVGRNTEKLKKEFERLEEERIKICKEFAKKDKSGNPVTVTSGDNTIYAFAGDNEKKCNEAYAEVLDTETDIMLFTVPSTVLEMCDTGEYDIPTVKEQRALLFMIEE